MMPAAGTYKVCDFGSATTKCGTPGVDLDREEATDDIEKMTTIQYRSPEQCDVWSNKRICEKVCTATSRARARARSLSRAIPKHFGLLSGNKHANKNVCIVICDLVMVLHEMRLQTCLNGRRASFYAELTDVHLRACLLVAF